MISTKKTTKHIPCALLRSGTLLLILSLFIIIFFLFFYFFSVYLFLFYSLIPSSLTNNRLFLIVWTRYVTCSAKYSQQRVCLCMYACAFVCGCMCVFYGHKHALFCIHKSYQGWEWCVRACIVFTFFFFIIFSIIICSPLIYPSIPC